jgi:hypothetical protein
MRMPGIVLVARLGQSLLFFMPAESRQTIAGVAEGERNHVIVPLQRPQISRAYIT